MPLDTGPASTETEPLPVRAAPDRPAGAERSAASPPPASPPAAPPARSPPAPQAAPAPAAPPPTSKRPDEAAASPARSPQREPSRRAAPKRQPSAQPQRRPDPPQRPRAHVPRTAEPADKGLPPADVQRAPEAPRAAPIEQPTVAPRPTALPPHQIEVGTVLRDRYELQALLGRGGMGSVYRALDRYRGSLGLPDRLVALKVASALPGEAGARALGREFQSAQQLSHPNVINVYEIDHEGQASFYTMELLDGTRLSEVLPAPAPVLPVRHALAIIRDIGAAVAYAHSRGIVHGDLKPQNVFITYGGQVRVLDFGGSSAPAEPWIGDPPLEAAAVADRRGEFRLGEAVDLGPYLAATPAYASCEQLEGHPADARDDLYALSCMAYQLFTGRHPFDGRSSLQARALRLRPRRPRALRADAWRALRQGLSFDRTHRALEVDGWLQELGVGQAIEQLPPHWQRSTTAKERARVGGVATAAVLLIGIAAAGWLLAQQDVLDLPGLTSSARAMLGDAWQQVRTRASDALGVNPPAGALLPQPPASPPQGPAGSAQPGPTGGPRGGTPDNAAAAAAATPPASTPQVLSGAGSPPVDEHRGAGASTASAATAGAVTFSASRYEVSGGAPAARIVVKRVGSARDELPFVWWTEAASAKPDVDYAPLGRRAELIPRGQHNLTIFVPIISNPLRQRPTEFSVALSEPRAAGASESVSARATVTINPSG